MWIMFISERLLLSFQLLLKCQTPDHNCTAAAENKMNAKLDWCLGFVIDGSVTGRKADKATCRAVKRFARRCTRKFLPM